MFRTSVTMSPDVAKKFKLACLKNDTTMVEVLREAVKKYIEKNEKKGAK